MSILVKSRNAPAPIARVQLPKKPGKRYEPKPTTPEHVQKATSCKGWFFEQLIQIESCFAGRWKWWSDVLLKGAIGDSQISQIAFTSPEIAAHSPYPMDEGMRLEVGTAHELRADIDRLFSRLMYDGTEVRQVVDWWLWACGDITIEKQPSFHDPRTQVTLYQEGMRVLCRMLAFPADWGSYILHEHAYAKEATGWFPTPMSLTQMMVQITMVGDCRIKSVYEPCMGTGVILMCASNHSLDLSGTDIDRDMCAWTRLHAYLYVPWLVCSGKRIIREFIERDKMIQRESDERAARAERIGNLKQFKREGRGKFPGRSS